MAETISADTAELIQGYLQHIVALEAEKLRLLVTLQMFRMGDGCAIGCPRMHPASHAPSCAALRAALDTPPT